MNVSLALDRLYQALKTHHQLRCTPSHLPQKLQKLLKQRRLYRKLDRHLEKKEYTICVLIDELESSETDAFLLKAFAQSYFMRCLHKMRMHGLLNPSSFIWLKHQPCHGLLYQIFEQLDHHAINFSSIVTPWINARSAFEKPSLQIEQLAALLKIIKYVHNSRILSMVSKALLEHQNPKAFALTMSIFCNLFLPNLKDVNTYSNNSSVIQI